MTYIEQDCAVTFGGRTFHAGGAVVTPGHIIAYPAEGGVLQDWHGAPIGTWRKVAEWRTPRSFVSSTMMQIEAVVDGVTYTGRGAGAGMVYKGRRKTG